MIRCWMESFLYSASAYLVCVKAEHTSVFLILYTNLLHKNQAKDQIIEAPVAFIDHNWQRQYIAIMAEITVDGQLIRSQF